MAVLQRVPLDRINAEAEQLQLRPGRTALTALAGLLYGAGWLLATLLRLVLTGLTAVLYGVGRGLGWAFVAVRVGWVDAAAGSRRRGPA